MNPGSPGGICTIPLLCENFLGEPPLGGGQDPLAYALTAAATFHYHRLYSVANQDCILSRNIVSKRLAYTFYSQR